MTGIAVFFFLCAVVFAGLSLADQRKRYWRFTAWRYRNPGANEPSDRAFAWQRGVLFAAAGVMAFQGVSVVRAADGDSWNEDELRQAVTRAASELEAEPQMDDEYSDYAKLIESKVGDAGVGAGPRYAVEVQASDAEPDDYTITADGVEDAFCMRISQTESAEGGFGVPGVGGRPDTFAPEYDLKATVGEGGC
ncbi:hypothetical protein QA943_30980 [Streptomyces sp. B21-097]|uniref:hypothetical protein n=1 Tax=Streptomyces sp. B21-097 TaxID=3039414 RepID=UPI002FEF4465